RFASRNRRTGEIQYARRPSIQSRAMRPGCSISARMLRHRRPSRSVIAPTLSAIRCAKRRCSGRNRRWPQATQYSPCIASPQLAQVAFAIGPPRPCPAPIPAQKSRHEKTPGAGRGFSSRLPPLPRWVVELLGLGGLHDLVGLGLGLRGGGLELALGDLADGLVGLDGAADDFLADADRALDVLARNLH